MRPEGALLRHPAELGSDARTTQNRRACPVQRVAVVAYGVLGHFTEVLIGHGTDLAPGPLTDGPELFPAHAQTQGSCRLPSAGMRRDDGMVDLNALPCDPFSGDLCLVNAQGSQVPETDRNGHRLFDLEALDPALGCFL